MAKLNCVDDRSNSTMRPAILALPRLWSTSFVSSRKEEKGRSKKKKMILRGSALILSNSLRSVHPGQQRHEPDGRDEKNVHLSEDLGFFLGGPSGEGLLSAAARHLDDGSMAGLGLGDVLLRPREGLLRLVAHRRNLQRKEEGVLFGNKPVLVVDGNLSDGLSYRNNCRSCNWVLPLSLSQMSGEQPALRHAMDAVQPTRCDGLSGPPRVKSREGGQDGVGKKNREAEKVRER